MDEFEGSACIKSESELKKLTIDDCLSCSGCIDSSSLNIFTPKKGEQYFWILSSVCLDNIYEYLNIDNLCYSVFEKLLFGFLEKTEQKCINSNDLQNFHLEKTLNALLNNREEPNKGIISSYCPGIVSYIEKTYCSLLKNLNQIKGAEMLAYEFILKLFDSKECDEMKILSVVSCFDKKIEDKRLESITTQQFLNFINELGFRDFIIAEVTSITEQPFNTKQRQRSFEYIEYFIENIPEDFKMEINKDCIVYESLNYKFLRVTGHTNILNVLKAYERSGVEYDFTELWVCEGGCPKGPGNLPLSASNNPTLINHENTNISNEDNQINDFQKAHKHTTTTNLLLEKYTTKDDFNYKREFNKHKPKKFTFKVDW